MSDEQGRLLSAQENDRCPMVSSFGVACELSRHHNSPHENNEHGKLTWEPNYVAVLRRDLELAHDALDGLAHAAREFSTEADYTVTEATEEEFVAAMDYAEKMVEGATSVAP